MSDQQKEKAMSRRAALLLGGGLVGTGGLLASGEALEAAPDARKGACIVTPQQVEGPYYFDARLNRRNIIEGHKGGVPLRLNVNVVDISCRPVGGARVDIWQCDAQGIYSAYPLDGASKLLQGDELDINMRGTTFLRGTQMTDQSGSVIFETIYPGWYRGRTTHIHFKVFLDQVTVLTAQAYLPDALSEFLYLNLTDYRRPRTRDTLNSTDTHLKEANGCGYMSVREASGGYVGDFTICVDRAARPPQGTEPIRTAPPPYGRALLLTAEERIRALVPGLQTQA